MILPFASRKKVRWNVGEHLDEIDRVIAEENLAEFQKDLAILYPKLQRYGLALILNEPELYQGVWHEYSITMLKELRRRIRNDTLDLEEWNANTVRINLWLARNRAGTGLREK